MTVALENILPFNFHPQSKLWIYQANRTFTMGEIFQIEGLLENFTAIWKSHGQPVKGFGTALYGQFIILMADESYTTVGGCSTDSSVHVIKEIEKNAGNTARIFSIDDYYNSEEGEPADIALSKISGKEVKIIN